MKTAERKTRLGYWFFVAMLGSLVVHAALFFWFQRTFLPQTILPSEEKLRLRKFKLERVEIDSKWLAPKLEQTTQRAPVVTTDRSSLMPSEEKRTFAELLSQTPSSPTLPAGAPRIPQEKPVPSLEIGDKPSLESRSQLEQELKSVREQQLQKELRNAGAGRPILPTPGAPVVPKSGSEEEMAPPTQPVVGPNRGPYVSKSGAIAGGSGRIEDFFGPQGGLPPVVSQVPKTPDNSSQAPQGLEDKPVLKHRFESLNPFLNVEFFNFERPGSKGVPEGYFLVRITAKPSKQLTVIPKDVFFVMDISSSIGAPRLASYVQTIQAAIGHLNPEDRFKVLAFRDRLVAFRSDWISASNPPLGEVKSWLEHLDTGGVTDLYDGLAPLLQYPREKGRVGLAILMSDGVPTKGVIDSTQIISDFSENNQDRISIFTLGSGQDANNFLLDLLSYCNQGWLRYSAKVEGSRPIFDHLVGQVRNPLFLDLRSRFAGVDADQIYPQSLPHLYQDSPLFLFGRYVPGQTGKVSLQLLGESQTETRELLVELPVPKVPNGPETLPATWARQRIYDLLGKMTRGRGNRDEILKEVRTLSEEYHVEVPYF